MKTTKKAASNIFGSLLSTLAGAGIAALNLYANGADGKQIGISAAALLLGAFAKDPSK